MAHQTLKDVLNSGASFAGQESVEQLAKFGDMMTPLMGYAVTQSSSATADMINLDTIVSGTVLPRARVGSNINVRAGGTSAVSQLWRVCGCMSVAVPTAGLTVAGADANGGILITPKSGYTVRYAQYVPAVNTAAIYPSQISVIEGVPAGFVVEVIYRIETTDGSTIAGTETATAVAAKLNANATFAKYALAAATGTGASEVRAQGATVRGILPVVTGAACAVSYDGSRIIFPTTVTDAILYLNAGPYYNLDSRYQDQPAR